MAGTGIIAAPILYIAFSLMQGSFASSMALSVAQILLMGNLTTTLVYSRLIAESITLARGAALVLMASTPAVAAALLAPVLNAMIVKHG